jgi:hypothetical protein
MIKKWLFRDGATVVECTSFPFAFRAMFMTVKQGVEKGKRKYDEMTRQMSIVSPMVDRNTGKPKVYNYAAATEFAKDTGVLTPDGQINSREFKRF